MKAMKLALLMLFMVSGVRAQEYQMFSGERISMFEYPYGEIIGVGFDSIINSGAIELFPNPNIQVAFYTNCATPYGNSWLAEKIIIRPDGTHVFISGSADSTFIHMQAKTGEKWIALRNEKYLISATVLSMEETSFLGITDTVKTIGFQAFDPAMNELEHFINNRVISVSKNYGATRLIGFSNFPEHSGFFPLVYYYDENPELSLTGITAEDLSAGIQNLTWFEVFDFAPGDEIHIINDQVDITASYNFSKIRKTIKKYLERHNYPDSIVYRVEVEWREKKEATGVITAFHDTITEVIHRNNDFDQLPGKPVIDSHRAFAYLMYNADPPAKVDPGESTDIWPYGNDTCWAYCCVDGCSMEYRYEKGLGGPYGSCTNAFSFGGTDIYYAYYRKGASTWGAPIDFTAIEDPTYEEGISVYPNPSTGIVHISTGNKEITSVAVMNISGELLVDRNINANEARMDLSPFKPGIYLLTVEIEGQRHFTRIIKQ